MAETDGAIAGYVAWNTGDKPKQGQISILAVPAAFRRQHWGDGSAYTPQKR